MRLLDWLGIVLAVITIVSAFFGAIRFIVVHYLSTLLQNSGGSLRDSVDRLELRVDEIYKILCK